MKLEAALIQSGFLCGELKWFEQIDSTNEYLLTHYRELPIGTVCLAESQTAGRGRRGRQWHSPASKNLYFSMFWRYDLAQLHTVSSLSLAVAVIIAETFEQLEVRDIQIKWPNDIYYQGKKMGGILIESRIDSTHFYVVIGIGLNLGMPNIETDSINQPWADLGDYSFDRNQIAAKLAYSLQNMLIGFPHTTFAEYLPRWQKFDLYYNKPVKLLTEQGDIYGIALGINEQGELLLQQENALQAFAIGEISLRASESANECSNNPFQ